MTLYVPPPQGMGNLGQTEHRAAQEELVWSDLDDQSGPRESLAGAAQGDLCDADRRCDRPQ